MGWGYYPPHIPVAQRRASALREVLKLERKGTRVSPVKVVGRLIASTFWGKAWCDHLESYSDFSNRLPRGRTYVRNGSVVDLQIEPGNVTSLVSGSSLYRISIQIRPLAASRWKKLKMQCGTQIGSLVELLQGRLSNSVMEIVTHRENGLFPAPAEIEMSCSCPDWAGMCKHIAATLYGVGSRLDHEPELLFKLRQVDHLDLITQAGRPAARQKNAGRKMIAKDRLADVFGIELETGNGTTNPAPAKLGSRGKSTPVQNKKASWVDIAKGKNSAVSGQSANSKTKAPSAKTRERVAQTVKKRRKALRKANQPRENATIPLQLGIVAKAAKAKLAAPAGNKSGRRTRSTAPQAMPQAGLA